MLFREKYALQYFEIYVVYKYKLCKFFLNFVSFVPGCICGFAALSANET